MKRLDENEAQNLRAEIRRWSANSARHYRDLGLLAFGNCAGDLSTFMSGGRVIGRGRAKLLRKAMAKYPRGWPVTSPPPEFLAARDALRAARRDYNQRGAPPKEGRLTADEIRARAEAVEASRRAYRLQWLAAEKPPLNGKPIGHRPIEEMVV